jgi:hypothetical protein
MGGACSIHIGKMRNVSKILIGEPERRDHSKGLVIAGRRVFKWIFGK